MEKPKTEQLTTISRKTKLATLLAAVVYGGFNISADINQGDFEIIRSRDSIKQPYSNEWIVISLNAHDESVSSLSPKISNLIKSQNPDVICLQEIYHTNLKEMMKNFPDHYAVFIGGDGNIGYADGKDDYYGNALISKQYPDNISTKRFDGTINWPRLFSDPQKVYKEKRAIVAASYKFKSNGHALDVRVANTHIDGDSIISSSQQQDVGQFAAQDLTGEDNLNIICGDLNTNQATVQSFLKPNEGWIVPKTKATSTDNRRQIDFLPYRIGNNMGLNNAVVVLEGVGVDKKVKTDHYAVVGKWVLWSMPATGQFR